MSPADEDALVNGGIQKIMGGCNDVAMVIRLAIRAAYARGVAEERERAARVCDELEMPADSPADDLSYEIATGDCAAAIRRGE